VCVLRARAAAAAAKKAAADAAAAKAAQERAGVQGLWFFEEHGTWKKFDAVGEQEVELAFQRGLQTVQSTFFNPRLQKQIVYTYDLNSMQQVNASTGFIRRIKREVPQAKDLVAEAPAATSKKKQKIAVGSKVELTSDYAAHSDAGNGPLKPGEIGVVTEVDGSTKPFNVKAPSGKEWWYKAEAVKLVGSPSGCCALCRDFQRGYCPRGASCKWQH